MKFKKKYTHRPWHTWVAIIMLMIVASFVTWGIRSIVKTPEKNTDILFGATFSPMYAEELGLDWKEVFLASMNDLDIKKFRIPAYWNRTEIADNIYDFSEVDFMMNQAAERNVKVLLAVGRKLPRWPECHRPDWVQKLPIERENEKLLEHVEVLVKKYKNHPALEAWQIENEPLFNFGICPEHSRSLLAEEVKRVKALDPNHPVIITDSGELSTWTRTSTLADVLGISMYRVAFNDFLGYWFYPTSPVFYNDRIRLIKNIVDDVIVTELQVEPWTQNGITETPLGEQFISMNEFHIKDNFDFASRINAKEVLIWGIEWWYWLKSEHQDDTIWELGKELLNEYNLKPPG